MVSSPDKHGYYLCAATQDNICDKLHRYFKTLDNTIFQREFIFVWYWIKERLILIPSKI